MATIVKQAISNTDNPHVTFAAADEYGDAVAHENRLKIFVRNGSGAPITVTLLSEVPLAPSQGQGPEDFPVAIPAGELGIIDLSNRTAWRDSVTGLVSWTYSAHADVSVAAVAF